MKMKLALLIILIEFLVFTCLSYSNLASNYNIKGFIGHTMGVLILRETFILLIYCVLHSLVYFGWKSLNPKSAEMLEAILLFFVFIIFFGAQVLGKYWLLVESAIISIPILLDNFYFAKKY